MNNIQQELRNLNPWWNNEKITDKIIPRPMYTSHLIEDRRNNIEILVGARRVGKTTVLMDVISSLIKKNVNKKHIIYITAELPALQNKSIRDVLDEYKTMVKVSNNEKIYYFIDEIQLLKNWHQEVKYLYDNYHIKFYLTGSSSLILNKYTALLTGRFIKTVVMPLSFSEFLAFKKYSISKDVKNNERLVNEYIDTGGYPEYVLEGNNILLVETIESILYRDLLTLYGIRNPAILKDLVQLLCDKVTTPVSFNTIAKDLKIDPQSVQFYMKYLEDVFLIYPLFRKGKSHKIVKGFTPKYYLNDTGVLRLFSRTPRMGHLAENVVFLHLKTNSNKKNRELFYDNLGILEVDFIFEDTLYDVKTKPLEENLLEEVTYIVGKEDSSFGYKQISLWKFLLE